jgi:hypothetical protein
MPDLIELITTTEFARLRRCSLRTLDRERAEGRGCPYIRLGARILYRRADIEHWIQQHVHGGAESVRKPVGDPAQPPRRHGRPRKNQAGAVAQ